MSAVRIEAFTIPYEGRTLSAVMSGVGPNVVVAAAEDGAPHDAWEALADACTCAAFVTYTEMGRGLADPGALDAVLDFIEGGAAGTVERIIIVGAGEAAVSALLAAGARGDDLIDGVVAISPCRSVGGREITTGDLRMITCPKLIIAAEFEDDIGDARDIFADLEDPRRTTIYPDEHSGTDMLKAHKESLCLELVEFFEWAFSR